MTKKRTKAHMAKVQKTKRAINRNTVIFAVVFALIGSILVYRSFAAPAAATGTASIRSSSTVQEPLVIDWSFNKSLKSLERPHINLGCFRDQNKDGAIDTSSWNSPDLVYGSQSYLYNSVSTFGPVIVTQDSRSGSKGYITIDLLSGSSKLVYEPVTSKTVKCSAELKVWDANLRQQTGGTSIAKTQEVTLTDTRY